MLNDPEKDSCITQSELLELFEYNEYTGKLIWKISRSNVIKVGQEVNHISKKGYVQVRLNGKLWMVHRLIWLMKTGAFPKLHIDHINGIRHDNSWSNLREVDRFLNMQNMRKAHKDSSTKTLGVTFDKQSGKYKAQMLRNGKIVLSKKFDTIKDASDCYNNFKEELNNDI